MSTPTKTECHDCNALTLFPWWADRDGEPAQVCSNCLGSEPDWDSDDLPSTHDPGVVDEVPEWQDDDEEVES